MAIGGIITVALLMALLFTVPMVDLDDDSRETYGKVMDISMEEMDAKSSLSAYEAMMFTIQAKPRSDVRQY